MAYPATTFEEAVDLTITASNQQHQIINGEATEQVQIEDGSYIPTVRKALVDNLYFKSPVEWSTGTNETIFNQLRAFPDPVSGQISWWYAPNATNSNPILMPTDPSTSTNWVVYGLTNNALYQVQKRLAAEAGFNLVGTTFLGCTLSNSTDVVLNEFSGIYYSWSGTFPKTVSAGTDPTVVGSGYVPRTDVTLRNMLTGGGSLAMPYAVVNVDLPPYNGDLSAALDSVAVGSALLLGSRDYDITGKFRLDTVPFPAGAWSGIEKKNIKIIGSGMPTMATDKSRFISGSGTVIQGALINFVDGFQCFNLGVDVGPWVVDTLNGGTWMEGFIPGTHKLNTSWDDFTTGGYIKDVHFGNIKVLMKDPLVGQVATFKHSMLIEYIDGGSHGYLESVGGFYGVVIKSRNIIPNGKILSYTHDSASVYFKSDQYTQCYHYRGGDICIGNALTSLPSPPVLFTAESGVEVGDVTFALSAYNVTSALKEQSSSGGGRVNDILIPSLDTRRTTQDAVTVPANADNWMIGEHNIVDGDAKGIVVVNGSSKCHISDGKVDQMVSDGYNLSGGATHGVLRPSNCGGYGVNNDGLAYVNPDRVSATSCASGAYNTMRQQAFTLLNSWVSLPSPEQFQVFDDGSSLRFSGRLGGTPADDVAMIMPAGKRPKKTQRFVCVGYNGTSQISVIAEVRSDGSVVVDRSAISGASPRGVDLSPVIFNY
ncbi:tail fiber protein [Pseudaeromonas phage vB_PpeM_ KLEP7]|nr:tail fiber protein [Pseudaeromonas phage vB_PpeM_ KLEP7]